MSDSIARRRPIEVPRLDDYDAAEDEEFEVPTRVNTIPPEVVEEMMRDAALVDEVMSDSAPPPSGSGFRRVDPSIERDVRDTCIDLPELPELPELEGSDDADSIDVEMFEQ